MNNTEPQMHSSSVCIVCGCKESLHEHHVIPRAYGGTNGPTVILCANHHNLVHTLALKPRNTWDIECAHVGNSAKIKELSQLIVDAKRASKDIIKPLQFNFRLNVERGRKLKVLQTKLSAQQHKKVSLQNVINHLIDAQPDE